MKNMNERLKLTYKTIDLYLYTTTFKNETITNNIPIKKQNDWG